MISLRKVLAIGVFAALYLGVFWVLPLMVGGSWLPWWGHIMLIHGLALGIGMIMALVVWAGNVLMKR